MGLGVALLALLAVSTLFPAEQKADDEPTEDAAAVCEEHGIAPTDPRVAPEPVFEAAEGVDVEVEDTDAADGVQLDEEFTSAGTTGSYHLFTRGVDFDEPVGVVVRLHGDGAFEYGDPDGLVNCLAEVAASHNMVLLAPLTPDERGDQTWWRDISQNLPWLQDLLQERVMESYTIDAERVWWMGYSGGAELITYGVLPRAPQDVTGGAVMIGGGGAPSAFRDEPTAEQRESLDLIWVTGALDVGTDPEASFDAVSASRQGSAWYRDQGFERVSSYYPDGHDHFSMPQVRILDEALEGDLGDQTMHSSMR